MVQKQWHQGELSNYHDFVQGENYQQKTDAYVINSIT